MDDIAAARAVMANWEALATAIATRLDGAVEDDARGFRFRTGLGTGFLNGVLRTAVAGSNIDVLAADTRAWYPDGLPWRWLVGPADAPDDLADRLEAAGFERRWPAMPLMAIDLATFDDTPWTDGAPGRVTEVLDRSDLDAWLSVRQENLNLPGATIEAWRRAHGEFGVGEGSALRHFVGWLDDRPVAGSTLFLDKAGGTAGIYHVDVLPSARGRGFGKVITAVPLGLAAGLGYAQGVLSASTLGTPVYLRLGFRDVGAATIFVGAAH